MDPCIFYPLHVKIISTDLARILCVSNVPTVININWFESFNITMYIESVAHATEVVILEPEIVSFYIIKLKCNAIMKQNLGLY